MSNDEYQHKTFCEEVKSMRKPKMKVDLAVFPGLALGISFPRNNYVDIIICVLCFGVHIKFKRR